MWSPMEIEGRGVCLVLESSDFQKLILLGYQIVNKQPFQRKQDRELEDSVEVVEPDQKILFIV